VQYKVLIYHDGIGVTAIGGCFLILLEAIIGLSMSVGAILFQSLPAVSAYPAGIHQAAGSGQIAYLELLYLVPDLYHTAYDLMARHHRKDGPSPLIPDLVKIGVAYSAI
jgi:hypothetical protein